MKKYKSLLLLRARHTVAQSNELSAEKKNIKHGLEKKHDEVMGINIIHQDGLMVAVEYAARKKGEKHFKPYKESVLHQDGNIILAGKVST